jgi:dihydropyrimidine dehydrogenase (NAD+) subunit PreT
MTASRGTRGAMTTTFPLEGERLERHLPDKKPLYDAAEARAEADRCLYCADAPCIKACPTEIDIPTFIKKIASGNVRGSARTILEQNILGHSCARVCPVEVLCQGACVYEAWQEKPIAIGRLQRYATEKAGDAVFDARAAATAAPPSVKRVACVGGGPASLAFAATLAMAGHEAVVLEKRAVPGGLNTTGIAPYKLHAEDALHEVALVQRLGVEIRTGVEVGAGGDAGAHLSVAALIDEYDAVFLGLGLGEDTRLGIPGEDGPGVVGATAWIE